MAGGWARGGDARPAARGRGPEARSYAVTTMAAVTGGRRPRAPFLQPAPRRGEAARGPPRPPRLPSPRPAPRCSGTWRRRCPIAPRRCEYGRPVLGLRRPAASGPARAPAATPLPWQPRGPPSPGCGRRPARRADSKRALGAPAGRQAARPECGAESGAELEQSSRRRDCNVNLCTSHQSRIVIFIRLTMKGTRGFCGVHSLPALNAWHSENHLPDLGTLGSRALM